jgi:hypothetical protein
MGISGLYHVMCRRNQGQPIFKELVQELHQDPAVLNRDLGKLGEELANKPELRSGVKTLYDSLRKRRRPKRSMGVCPTLKLDKKT